MQSTEIKLGLVKQKKKWKKKQKKKVEVEYNE